MTIEQIHRWLQDKTRGEQEGKPELIETHISWVILYDHFVFKIKKPVHYSFVDFSTLEKRKYYCEREVALNRRLTDNLYLDVQPVRELAGRIIPGGTTGEIIDYAVRMRKLDRDRQMDLLLLRHKVSAMDIRRLAEKIAAFHHHTGIVYDKPIAGIRYEFNDLEKEKEYLIHHTGPGNGVIIARAIDASDTFLERKSTLLAGRLKAGLFRDCHGDLHSRNIFLLDEPQPFDCLEFNDDFRRIDVLNEVAFLCMDLEAFDRKDLSNEFLACYNKLFPAIRNEEDQQLYLYYKSYRANIRAKVNSLRARSATDDKVRKGSLATAAKYLHLMDCYLQELRLYKPNDHTQFVY